MAQEEEDCCRLIEQFKIRKNFARALLVLLLILFRMDAVRADVIAGEARTRMRRVGIWRHPHIASLRALLLGGVETPCQRAWGVPSTVHSAGGEVENQYPVHCPSLSWSYS